MLTPVAPSPLPEQPAAPEVPRVREDGRCVVCGKPRHPERSRQYAGVAAELDPFDSNTCARSFFNNPLPARSIWSKPGSDRKYEAA